jgi:hypothetical protein
MAFASCRFACADDSGSLPPLGVSDDKELLLRRHPENRKCSSSTECDGSDMLSASGSATTITASSYETPCFFRLLAVFAGFHSNS